MQLSCYFTSYIPLTYSLYGRPGSFVPLSPARTCSRSIFSDHCYPLSLQCFYSVWIPSNVLFSTVIFVCRYCRPRSLCGSGIKEFLEARSCLFFPIGSSASEDFQWLLARFVHLECHTLSNI
jgi:hypothetical protein